MKRLLGIALAVMALMPGLASARVIVGFGPAYRPYGLYGYGYGPYWGGPYWRGYPMPSRPATGAAKLETREKNASV